MKLSVVMPVFNESKTVGIAIKRVLSTSNVHQLIIVNDASTDDSLKVISKIKDKKITLISHKTNKGKGACIQTSIEHITGDFVIINDADLEYDPNDIKNLIKPIKNNKAEVVFGSRFQGPHTNMFFWHYLGNKLLNLIINLLYNTTLSDMESCYKLLPTKLLKSLNLSSTDFGIEPEITCKILKKGIRIYEVPISYSGRGYEEGKKLHWTQGIIALKIILTQKFISH